MGSAAQGLRPGHGLHQSGAGLLRPAQPVRGSRRHVLRALVRHGALVQRQLPAAQVETGAGGAARRATGVGAALGRRRRRRRRRLGRRRRRRRRRSRRRRVRRDAPGASFERERERESRATTSAIRRDQRSLLADWSDPLQSRSFDWLPRGSSAEPIDDRVCSGTNFAIDVLLFFFLFFLFFFLLFFRKRCRNATDWPSGWW